MKTVIKGFIIVIIICLQSSYVRAVVPVSGTKLEIGPTGSDDQVNGAQISGAIGWLNSNSAQYSLTIGTSNNVWGLGNSLWAGEFNEGVNLDGIVVGKGNSGANFQSAIIGSYNIGEAETGDDYFQPPQNSLVVGDFNYAHAVISSFICGTNNSSSFARWSGTLGTGLINNWDNCLVIGQYNTSQSGTILRFVVGNGTSSIARKNSFEIYDDGVIVIPKRQGDVGMGQFGNGGSDL